MSTFLKVGFVSVVLLLALVGCTFFPIQAITGSGDLMTEEYAMEGFTRVRAGNAFQVTVTQGDRYAVVVTRDNNLDDDLIVEQDGDTLVLGLRERVMLRNVTLRAEITMPALDEIEFSGATSGRVTGFRTDGDFRVHVSGASTLNGDIEADVVRIDVSGASNVTMTGAAQSLEATVSGASRANLRDLAAGDVRAEASGASTVRVSASGELEAQASGASTIEYSGNPAAVREETSGASTIREAN